ncbi:hypothetical protein ELE36_04990 [Pseudolysobacter antarcticus]|uniref:Spore coat protein U domain-containing protein n=1 Tax=Pseudolysobacter antarcticus TaxID=2511995 RepID=A0A411HH12_9GAMM|nr:hypothetical protein [Pseudolysobacter antarcticus]QBB69783.1 hypothetical protein ELE36_04990 [Pseudolysobacter antarcticus]
MPVTKTAIARLGALLLVFAVAPAMAGTISVTSGNVAPSSTTCTLAQAIYAANLANNPTNATPAGATTISPLSNSATASTGNCSSAALGANTIDLANFAGQTLSYSTADNYWYGPNALPPVASDITIEGYGVTLQISGTKRLRFFFVGADAQTSATPGYNTPARAT